MRTLEQHARRLAIKATQMSLVKVKECVHDSRQDILDGSGAVIAVQCRTCPKIIRSKGRCDECKQDGWVTRFFVEKRFCSDECIKNERIRRIGR